MIYLAISIIATAGMILMFKVFDVFKINNLQGLFFNYLTASLWCNIMADQGPVFAQPFWRHDWFPYTLILGTMFISIFYATAITAQKIAVSVSIVAGKMSLVLTVLFISFYFGEHISWVKWVGIGGSLLAVYFTTRRNEPTSLSGMGSILFPLIVFVGSGLVDSSLKLLEHKYFADGDVNEQLAVTFASAGITGVIVWLIQRGRGRSNWHPITWKAVVAGITLGSLNYLSTYTLIKSLNMHLMDSSAIFPVINIGVVALTSLAAVVMFKEKLSKMNIAGIGMALVFIWVIAADQTIIEWLSR